MRSDGAWSQQAGLKPSNSNAGDDFFGYSLAIDGDTIVVGAPTEDSGESTIINGGGASGDNSVRQSGAAYVFVRSDSLWTQQAYLKAPTGDFEDFFGHAVAISGDTVAVSAIGEDANQASIINGEDATDDDLSENSGAVYIFARGDSLESAGVYQALECWDEDGLIRRLLPLTASCWLSAARMKIRIKRASPMMRRPLPTILVSGGGVCLRARRGELGSNGVP